MKTDRLPKPLVEQVAEDLKLPPGAELVGGIVFEPLDVDAELPPPEFLVDDVLYDGPHFHIFSGHPGDGKTSLTMQLAWIAMAQGKHVVWLDYEGGKVPTIRRIQDVGLPASLVKERFHYASFPADAEKHLTAIHEKWNRPLVVLDSFSKALAYAGVNENEPPAVTAWTVPVVRACKQHDMPLVIIDHVSRQADSRYSRGAGSKLADVDVHWRVEKTQEFDRNTIGSITVTRLKDRSGFFPRATWWRMGDGQGNLTVEPMDSPPDADTPNAPEI